MNRLLFITLFLLLSDSLQAQENTNVAVPNIVLETPSSSLPWVVVCILIFVILVLIAVIMVLTKKKLSMVTALNPEIKKEVEEVYARKVKREYLDKQKVLDNKLNQVRLRFAIVMGRVKTLLDTLAPDKLFNAICELIQTDVGANRYILFLLDNVKHELYPYRWYGYSDDIKKMLIIPDNLPHILCYALKRKQNVFKADAEFDPELVKIIDNKPDLKTLVAIPLFCRDKLFGVIHIESFEDGHEKIDDNESKFLVALPSFIGSAITNADIFMETREELESAKQVSEREIAEKRRLHDIFSRYTSAELIEDLLKHPEKVDLGGTVKNASILFSDIAGFTHFSSQLSPKEVVIAMNDYLSRMTEVVLDYQGEIDKFIGDAVMARFGVLSDLPYPSQNAIQAACAMLIELKKLKAEWAQRGMNCFNIRIGIATGPVLAGNIGSKRRQEFTVMGTTVNLASRLEAYNKTLGTTLAIDEESFKYAPKNIEFVKHENQTIRGLDTPVNVYTFTI
ncbi:MAG: GAF domain-containing protein [Candidatus Riflebacteria bacterium]|nr:GAF domain-containing protein [Candidatus Riflebacteria bacterium]MBR4569088.1 GAF domain-containing protein [Candidatus Riflebacteria bacterium]